MDGCKILNSVKIKTSFIASLAAYENKLLSKINLPGKIVVLEVSLKNSLKRKKEHVHKIQIIRDKIIAINSLRIEIEDNSKFTFIDSNKPKQKVILELKSKIWDLIQ